MQAGRPDDVRTTTTKPIGLSIADVLPDAQMFGAGELHATSCTSDADAVRPGDIFFAIDGHDCDGHELAGRAVKRGAKALVVERPLALFGTPQIVVEDSREAYGQYCQRLVGSPSDHLPIVGIAGSAGKTSTATLLRSILRTAGMTAGYVAGDELGDGVLTRSGCSGELTAPALATWLARMVAHDCSHAVLEITTGLLQRRVTAGVTLDVACIMNMDRDRASSLAATRQRLSAVVSGLPANGVAVVNADDPSCNHLLATINTPTITFAMKRPAEITAKIIRRNAAEQAFILSTGQELAAVRTTIIGDSHVYNCLAAAAIATVYDIDLATIARGLESVTQLPGVMQRIDSGQEFCAFVDRARSSRSLEACLHAAREVSRGRVITVVREYKQGKSRGLWETAEKLSDVTVRAANFAENDQATAIAEACLRAAAGDVVLVASPESEVRDEDGQSWNDVEVVRELLRQIQVV
jgi:UDP-N-acetylmuramoyl-L-alanyl-D-glutamate--2,6-diaminopimelate ligase